ncbi:DNA-processing protein DprA [Streptococcaceae bacterium ESL0729]|nr:DNA-processing protein DprA [Streptococcaceae bacterium ESL0729]
MRLTNGFDIYKLKRAGMTNLGILKLTSIDYNISLRQAARIAGVKNPEIFLDNYKSLDIKEERKKYLQYSSLSIFDDKYPSRLREIYNPPALIFYSGDIDLLERPILSFVGSRQASELGLKASYKLIRELGNRFVIASGLARGIDTASHMSTLKNGGQTIAVIATGLNRYYPKENKKLQDFIATKHLLISEYLPDEDAKKFHFPERNRILAGLALGVVVVEAKIRSGSLITSMRAMEEGRDVFAVPGSIIEGYFSGCNKLIQDGAKLIAGGQDILEEYSI